MSAPSVVRAVDTMGIWYGLRIPADPKGEGIPIAVFGGPHGDLPLLPTSGHLAAEVVVREGISAVIDMSRFDTDAQKARFVSEFADRLYRLKQSSPSAVHVFLEEAHEFIPQNPQKGEENMVHHVNRMWKQGRNFGIGGSVITQRPQDVNKKASELSAAVFAFNITGPLALKAVEAWMKAPEVAELPRLPLGKDAGKCLVYSPAWLGFTGFARIHPKRTFHVSFDPFSHAPIEAADRTLAPVAIEGLRAAFEEEAKGEADNDPKTLKARIKELEERLNVASGLTAPKSDPAEIARAVEEATAPLLERLEVSARLFEEGSAIAEKVAAAAESLRESSERLFLLLRAKAQFDGMARERHDRAESARQLIETGRAPLAPSVNSEGGNLRKRPKSETSETGGLAPVQQDILDTVALYNGLGTAAPRIDHVFAYIGRSHTAGHSRRMLNGLRDRGLVEFGSGWVRLTEEGRELARPTERVTLAQLHERWIHKVGGLGGDILRLVLAAHPEPVSLEDVFERLQRSPNAGHSRRELNRPKSMGLIEHAGGRLRATSLLFPEGLR